MKLYIPYQPLDIPEPEFCEACKDVTYHKIILYEILFSIKTVRIIIYCPYCLERDGIKADVYMKTLTFKQWNALVPDTGAFGTEN
jgi:hypothetical protein